MERPPLHAGGHGRDSVRRRRPAGRADPRAGERGPGGGRRGLVHDGLRGRGESGGYRPGEPPSGDREAGADYRQQGRQPTARGRRGRVLRAGAGRGVRGVGPPRSRGGGRARYRGRRLPPCRRGGANGRDPSGDRGPPERGQIFPSQRFHRRRARDRQRHSRNHSRRHRYPHRISRGDLPAHRYRRHPPPREDPGHGRVLHGSARDHRDRAGELRARGDRWRGRPDRRRQAHREGLTRRGARPGGGGEQVGPRRAPRRQAENPVAREEGFREATAQRAPGDCLCRGLLHER